MTGVLLELGDCVVDLELHEVRRGSEVARLSKNEALLLDYLAQRVGQPVSKDTLHVEVFGYAVGVVSRAADYTVHRLRKKVERDPANPEHLVTVPGVGVRLVLEVEAPAPAEVRSVLPGFGTTFVGREDELRDLSRILGEDRLVTLVGPPGCGKTRLAVRAARGRPAVLCDLTGARTASEVVAAVTEALGIEGMPAPGRLDDALAGRGATLLLLDNLEQVVAPAAELIGRWLGVAGDLAILGTSRQRLGVPGERVVELGPMPAVDARDLFVERARSARPSFALRDDDGDVVTELVARLDGLPLAIELAAARSPVLTPRQILERTARSPAESAWQAALEASLRGSWELLDPDQRGTMAQLAVFRSPFDIDAAEAVVRVAAPVIDCVQALRERSLLMELSGGDRLRFRFLSSVRDYAEAQCGDLEAVRLRHAEWAVGQALAITTRIAADPDTAGRTRLRTLREELLGVVDWAAATEARLPLLARALVAAGPVWRRTRPVEAFVELVRRVLDDEELDAETRLMLHLARAGMLSSVIREPDLALADAEEAAHLALELGRPLDAARAHATRVALYRQAHAFEDADAALRQASQVLAGHPPGRLHVRLAVIAANVAMERRDPAARDLAQRALELASHLGAPDYAAVVALNLAVLAGREGARREQARLATRALEAARGLHDHHVERRALLALATAEAELGRYAAAVGHAHEALALCDRLHDTTVAREVLTVLIEVELARGEIDEVEGHITHARRLRVHRPAWMDSPLRAYELLVAWMRWGVDPGRVDGLRDVALTIREHIPQVASFFEAKWLAARAALDDDPRAELDPFDELSDEARDAGRDDLAAAIEVDRAHVYLALAAAGDDVEANLGRVQAALEGTSPGLAPACSQTLLASLLAAHQLDD